MEEEKREQETANQPEAISLLQAIAQSSRQQEKYARRQYVISLLTACACATVALVLLVGGLLTGSRLMELVAHTNEVMTEADMAVAHINEVAENVKALDLQRLTQSVTTLAEEGTEGIASALDALDQVVTDTQEAVKKLSDLDVEGLNQGIARLNETLDPLAKFFRLTK